MAYERCNLSSLKFAARVREQLAGIVAILIGRQTVDGCKN